MFGVVHEESGARLVLLCTAVRATTAIARKKSGNASSETTAASTSQHAETGPPGPGIRRSPGTKDPGDQEILEQTDQKQLLSRTNAYGDGCFRAARKRGPIGSIEVPRFVPIPLPVNTHRFQLQRIGERARQSTDEQTRDCARFKHRRELEESQRDWRASWASSAPKTGASPGALMTCCRESSRSHA